MVGATAGQMQEAVVKQGMLPLYDDGMKKVAEGITSLEEVLRVAAA